MKSITIMRMRPGAETQAKALELFMKHGPSAGTEWVLAAANSQVYVTLGDLDQFDAAAIATYAPYFEMETIPVIAVDEAWLGAMQEAVARQV